MPGQRLGWMALAALVLANVGCCSFWERHCAPHPAPAPVACVPVQAAPACCPPYAPPAYAPPAPVPSTCPPGCAPTSGWQRPPY
jgi:hypothetical protein